jgi:arginyl-tRNA synthetase
LTIRNLIQKEIKNVLNQAFGAEGLENLMVKMEYPPDPKMGDYATPVALECARILKRPPRQIATALQAELQKKGPGLKIIESVEIAGPGFLNIFLAADLLYSELVNMADPSVNYGKEVALSEKSEPILLEYVSANPTGPLNIVSARAASLGSSLYNLLKYAGIEVFSEYYINDYGNQVENLAKSVAVRFLQRKNMDIPFPEDGYHGEYIYDVLEHCLKELSHELANREWSEKDLSTLSQMFLPTSLAYIIASQKEDLEKFGIVFDSWFSEKLLHKEQKPMAAFALLEKSGFTYQEDGKQVFRSTAFGDDKDRVLIRSDGRPAYFVADIAYHLAKIQRGFPRLINIWGPDHHGYIARLKGALQAAGHPENTLEVLIAQQVNLLQEGEAVKMSKRMGKFTTLRELMSEIPRDVARYFFVMRAADSPLDFDLELAKSQTMDNPVYYIQYAHARICSVLRENALSAKIEPGSGTADFFLAEPSRRNLMLWLLRFPDEISDVSRNYEVHRFAQYLKDLAGQFQKFYQKKDNRVLGGEAETSKALLLLMLGAKNILSTGLALLGLEAPESM